MYHLSYLLSLRSKMIECLQSFEYHWARLDDFIAKCLSRSVQFAPLTVPVSLLTKPHWVFRFSLEVTGDMIRSRCSGAIELLLDDPSDHMNKVSQGGATPEGTAYSMQPTIFKVP